MSLEKRQRLAFFVLALFLHAAVFYLVFHLVIFSAPIPGQVATDFTEFPVPTHPPTPPEAPAQATLAMPKVTPPPPTEAAVIPIVTTMPSTFAMPKVDVISPRLPELPALDEQPAMTPLSSANVENGTGKRG